MTKTNKFFLLLSLCASVLHYSCSDEKPEIIEKIEAAASENARAAEAADAADTRPESKADKLVEAQLAAYNQRDLEAFLLPFSDSVRVYTGRKLDYEGKDNMRKGYAEWFGGLDTLHCKIVKRISAGNTVIDYERYTFKKKGGEANTAETIAMYKIRNDKIQEITFIRPQWDY